MKHPSDIEWKARWSTFLCIEDDSEYFGNPSLSEKLAEKNSWNFQLEKSAFSTGVEWQIRQIRKSLKKLKYFTEQRRYAETFHIEVTLRSVIDKYCITVLKSLRMRGQ